jgi:hypothetical protein
MHPAMLKLMRAKKTRAVDPLAPPRPTLLGHDKQMRQDRSKFDDLARLVVQLQQRLETAESKIRYQTQIIGQISATMVKKSDKSPRQY